MRKQSIISSRLVAILAALAVALVAVAVILSKCGGTAVVEEKNDHVEVTPATIASIKSIGQWEFLTIHDEEYVDTVREGFFSDDGLARIYYGTLRLGLDMSHLDDHAIRMEGDTVLVATLPPVRLLDRHFIDEARTRPFYEKGRWEADAREVLYRRAQQMMTARCLTRANLQRAEDRAREELTRLFHLMGYKNVRIQFEEAPV